MAAQTNVWSYIRLLLCLGSAYLVAILYSDGANDPAGVWVTCLGNWLAIWLFLELHPLRDEQYTSRMLFAVFKYGPVSLFLIGLTLVLISGWLDALSDFLQPAPVTSPAAVAYP